MKTELSEAEHAWLQEAARRVRAGEQIDKRAMMVQLRDRLPRGFQPSDVRPGLLHPTGPTVEGLRALGDSGDLVQEVEEALRWIRDQIIEDPRVSQVSAEGLAESIGVEITRARRLLELVCTLSGFSGGSTGSAQGGPGPLSILVDRDDIVANYLGFTSLENHFDSDVGEGGRAVSIVDEQIPVGESSDVFVLMNMDPLDPSLDDVLNGIKEVCARFGLEAMRIDEEEHSDQITSRIIQRIRESDIIIADLSGERPNVYYEVGFAHALEKRPILYRRSGTKLHFDLSVHNVPEYTNLTELKERLHGRLEAILGRSAKQDAT